MPRVNKDFLLKVTGVQWPHWSTIALWTVGILVMTGLTAKDLYPLLNDYFDPDVNVQVKIETKPGDTAGRPKLHLCVPLPTKAGFKNFSEALWKNLTRGTACPECEILAEHSFDVWRHCSNITEISADRTFVQNLDTCFANYLINNCTQNNCNSAITVENLPWNRPVIHSLVTFLGDVARRGSGAAFNYLFAPDASRYKFSENQLDAVRSLLISFVCEIVWFHDGTGSTSSAEEQCYDFTHGSITVWPATSANYICMELSQPSEQSDFIHVHTTMEYFDSYMLDERGVFQIFTDNPTHGDGMLPLYSTSSKDVGSATIEMVTITYTLQSMVVEDRPQKLSTCYKETSKNECQRNCRLEMMEAVCHCRFFFDGNRTVQYEDDKKSSTEVYHIEYCDSTLIYNCAHQNPNDFRDCIERCKDPCEAASFQYLVTTDIKTSDDNSPAFGLTIQAREQPYLEFTMAVRCYRQDLICQIGGVFNFYLGLSGLSIVFFLIYIFDSGRRLQRLKDDNENNNRGDTIEMARRPSAGPWRSRWMQLAASVVDTSSKESDLKTEIFQLKSSLKESEAIHKQDIDELTKMTKDLQAQNRAMVQQMKDFEVWRVQIEATIESGSAAKFVPRRPLKILNSDKADVGSSRKNEGQDEHIESSLTVLPYGY